MIFPFFCMTTVSPKHPKKIMISNFFFKYFFSFESWWSMDVGSWCISTNYDADWNEKDWGEIEFPEKCSYLFKDVQWYLVEAVWCPWSGEYYFFRKKLFLFMLKFILTFFYIFCFNLKTVSQGKKIIVCFVWKKKVDFACIWLVFAIFVFVWESHIKIWSVWDVF